LCRREVGKAEDVVSLHGVEHAAAVTVARDHFAHLLRRHAAVEGHVVALGDDRVDHAGDAAADALHLPRVGRVDPIDRHGSHHPPRLSLCTIARKRSNRYILSRGPGAASEWYWMETTGSEECVSPSQVLSFRFRWEIVAPPLSESASTA